MSILQKSPKKTSSRRQINIKGVRESILLLPNNQYRAVLEVSSVNFELKSENEQDVLIDTYESFLNSLPCPLQIVVHIRELDMSKYLADLYTQLAQEKQKVYRAQLQNYSDFVMGLVAANKILSRHFYAVLPYSGTKESDFETVKEQLTINSDIVSRGLSRLGMQSRQLEDLEILDLFYSFYNPGRAKLQPLNETVLQQLTNEYIQGVRR